MKSSFCLRAIFSAALWFAFSAVFLATANAASTSKTASSTIWGQWPTAIFSQATNEINASGSAQSDINDAKAIMSMIGGDSNIKSNYTSFAFKSYTSGNATGTASFSKEPDDPTYTIEFTVTWPDPPADTTPPSVPGGLSSTDLTSASFTLNWSASTDDVQMGLYEVRRDSTSLGTVTGTSIGVAGLSPSTGYSMTVRAQDAAGNWSDWSSPLTVTTSSVPDTTPPSIPGGLASSNLTVNSFALHWTASTDNVSVYGYEVRQGTTSLGVSTSGTVRTIGGLSAGTTYAMSVRAQDGSGNWSDWSSPLNVTTSGISGNSTSKSASTITYGTWPTAIFTQATNEINASNATSAAKSDATAILTLIGADSNVQSNYTSGDFKSYTVGSATGTANFTKEPDAPTYSIDFTIIWPVATADTSPPTKPTALTSGDITNNSFTLSWTASSDNVAVTSYEVKRDVTVLSGTTPTTSRSISGLTANTAYSMSVRAHDGAGNVSDWSDPVAVTTGAAGSTGYNTTTKSVTTISFGSWNQPVFNQAASEINTSNSPSTARADALAVLALIGTASNIQANYTSVDFKTYTSGTATGTATFSKEPDDPTYHLDFTVTWPGGVADTSPPGVPSGLPATSVTSTSLTLNWTVPTDNVGVTGYEVKLGSTSVGSPAVATQSVSALLPSTTYAMTVRARDAAGNFSAWSTPYSVTTSAAGSSNTNSTSKSVSTTIFGQWPVAFSTQAVNEINASNSSQAAKNDALAVLTLINADIAVQANFTSMLNRTYTVGSATGVASFSKDPELTNYDFSFTITWPSGGASTPLPPTYLIKDTFQTSGNLVGSNPQVGVGTWTQIASGAALVVSGGKVAVLASNDQKAQLNFNTANFTTGTIYAAVTIRVASGTITATSNTLSTFFGFRSGTPASGVYELGLGVFRPSGTAQASGALNTTTSQFQIGFGEGSSLTAGGARWGSVSAVDTDYRVVIEWNLDNDTGRLWVNPTSISSPSVSLAGLIGTARGVYIREGAGTHGQVSISNLLVSTDFTAVANSVGLATPSGLSATSITRTSFRLSWAAAGSNSGVTGYKVYRNGGSPVSVSGNSLLVTGLTASTAYSMTVQAQDAAGNLSSLSAPYTVTTAATSAPEIDSDGDGVSDAVEILLGLNPNDPNDVRVYQFTYDRINQIKTGPGGQYDKDAEGNVTKVHQ